LFGRTSSSGWRAHVASNGCGHVLLNVLLGLTLERLFDGGGIAFMFRTSLKLSSEYSVSAKLGPSSKEGVRK
jgi:hypothetical protein